MQKPMTCPPVWRWRFTFPSPSTLRRLIQRPVARSNLKGLNQTLSPWGTQGNSSLWTAMSGSPIAAMTCSVRSSAKAFSSPSPKACSLARYRAAFNSVRRSVITQVLGLVLRGVDELDRAPVIARLAGGVGLLLEFGLDLHRGSQAIGRDREVERSRAADVWRGHGGARREHRAAADANVRDRWLLCVLRHPVDAGDDATLRPDTPTVEHLNRGQPRAGGDADHVPSVVLRRKGTGDVRAMAVAVPVLAVAAEVDVLHDVEVAVLLVDARVYDVDVDPGDLPLVVASYGRALVGADAVNAPRERLGLDPHNCVSLDVGYPGIVAHLVYAVVRDLCGEPLDRRAVDEGHVEPLLTTFDPLRHLRRMVHAL